MSSTVRVGVIGTSSAQAYHLPSLQAHPGAAVVAICGRNRERAQKVAERFEIPEVFTDYRAMLADAQLDAVLIASPDYLHGEMIEASIEAKLHTLTESPLSLSVDEAIRLCDAASAQPDVVRMVAYNLRWHPLHQELKRRLVDGYVGRAYHCETRLLGHYRALDPAMGWKADSALSWGGSVTPVRLRLTWHSGTSAG